MSRLSAADHLTFQDKLRHLNWGLVGLIVTIGLIGVALLYSAGGKSWHPWAGPQLSRFAVGLSIMLMIALVDVRVWLRIAYPLYGVMLVLLVVVEVMGHIGMGAQRWINLGFFVLQPSELMKIALVLALAKYFHSLSLEDIGHPIKLVAPILMVLTPVGLVLAATQSRYCNFADVGQRRRVFCRRCALVEISDRDCRRRRISADRVASFASLSKSTVNDLYESGR